MRVTFDSNAWESVFESDGPTNITVREALNSGRIEGCVCEALFRIEAVRRYKRPHYFARPKLDVSFPGDIVSADGKLFFRWMSIGPDDSQHPGLPEIQSQRWQRARSAGIRLIHGLAWMGLPSPAEASVLEDFIPETPAQRNAREQRQMLVNDAICRRGLGKALFDKKGGWKAIENGQITTDKFDRACAEWADGELVAAHVAYGNDVLCTNDQGRAAGISIFNAANRAWLSREYGVRFATPNELAEMVGS